MEREVRHVLVIDSSEKVRQECRKFFEDYNEGRNPFEYKLILGKGITSDGKVILGNLRSSHIDVDRESIDIVVMEENPDSNHVTFSKKIESRDVPCYRLSTESTEDRRVNIIKGYFGLPMVPPY